MEDRKPEHGYFSQHVEEAIRSGWIHIYYMPVIRTITGQITSFECLARWKDPVYGLVMPGMFIRNLSRAGRRPSSILQPLRMPALISGSGGRTARRR